MKLAPQLLPWGKQVPSHAAQFINANCGVAGGRQQIQRSVKAAVIAERINHWCTERLIGKKTENRTGVERGQ